MPAHIVLCYFALMRGNFILLTFAHSNDVALSESNREFIMGLASTLKFSATSYSFMEVMKNAFTFEAG